LRIITFSSSVGGVTLSWTPDADYDVVAFYGSAGQAVLSGDPALTYAGFTTPIGDSVIDEFRIPAYLSPQFRYRLNKGQPIYVAMSSGGNVQTLVLDDPQLTSFDQVS